MAFKFFKSIYSIEQTYFIHANFPYTIYSMPTTINKLLSFYNTIWLTYILTHYLLQSYIKLPALFSKFAVHYLSNMIYICIYNILSRYIQHNTYLYESHQNKALELRVKIYFIVFYQVNKTHCTKTFCDILSKLHKVTLTTKNFLYYNTYILTNIHTFCAYCIHTE